MLQKYIFYFKKHSKTPLNLIKNIRFRGIKEPTSTRFPNCLAIPRWRQRKFTQKSSIRKKTMASAWFNGSYLQSFPDEPHHSGNGEHKSLPPCRNNLSRDNRFKHHAWLVNINLAVFTNTPNRAVSTGYLNLLIRSALLRTEYFSAAKASKNIGNVKE